jgi:hypothetical protein
MHDFIVEQGFWTERQSCHHFFDDDTISLNLQVKYISPMMKAGIGCSPHDDTKQLWMKCDVVIW